MYATRFLLKKYVFNNKLYLKRFSVQVWAKYAFLFVNLSTLWCNFKDIYKNT